MHFCTNLARTLIETITDEDVSRGIAPDDRAGLGRALSMLDAGDADVLIAASLSRLGRPSHRNPRDNASEERSCRYLSSDGFSLTDIDLAVVSRWAQQEHWRPLSLPKVERLTAALATRPATAAVWARHFGTM